MVLRAVLDTLSVVTTSGGFLSQMGEELSNRFVDNVFVRCAHASRGGTLRSCRLTGCVARIRGLSCTLAMDTSGAVSHDVGKPLQ